MISVPMDEDGMRIDLLTKLCDRRPPADLYGAYVPESERGNDEHGKKTAAAGTCPQLPLSHCGGRSFFRSVFSFSPPPSIKSMDRDGHVVYMKSFSKVLAPGCRMACVAAEGDILERLTAAKAASDLGGPLLIQLAVLPFISDRYDVYMKGLRSALRSRMERAAKLLKRHAPQG